MKKAIVSGFLVVIILFLGVMGLSACCASDDTDQNMITHRESNDIKCLVKAENWDISLLPDKDPNSDIISIHVTNINTLDNQIYFEQALATVLREYIIIQITPISKRTFDGSTTSGLLLQVKPLE